MKNKFRKLAMFLLFVPLVIMLFGFAVMYLWNLTLPAVLNVSTITFWQALGILLLSKILFGGFRGGWGNRGRHWNKKGFKERFQQDWRSRMENKLAAMTPAEKEKFKQEWKNRCSRWGKPANEDSVNQQSSPSSPE